MRHHNMPGCAQTDRLSGGKGRGEGGRQEGLWTGGEGLGVEGSGMSCGCACVSKYSL